MTKGEYVINREATCTTPGEKKTGITVCKRPGCGHMEGGEIVTDPAKGHDWGEFETDQDMTPNETCVEKTVLQEMLGEGGAHADHRGPEQPQLQGQ